MICRYTIRSVGPHRARHDLGPPPVVGPDGTVAVSGIDVGELADDGRLRRITGFFGELPARDDE